MYTSHLVRISMVKKKNYIVPTWGPLSPTHRHNRHHSSSSASVPARSSLPTCLPFLASGAISAFSAPNLLTIFTQLVKIPDLTTHPNSPQLTSELPLCIHIASFKRILIENEVDRYANDLFTDGLDSVNKPTVDVARLSTSVSMVRNNTHVDYGATRHAGTQNQTVWNLPASTQGDSSVPPPPPYSGSPPPTGLPQPNDRLPVAPPWSPL